ncbi:FAD-dependent monooxygenase [Halococcus sp. IIIV-5B]|uniref:FAD-dependent monooxygenase n=1 Tax=Halococcus sp. IIIV-5B TaxID=2321230 RepID=UPI000E71180F|nr:FAD-dependent monooxygenase [Halococcus sp. IIIV-5B]RJT06740.1 2-polyprenyl-6-methoxyphenol hydroxylase [Halococcus sp. IIIV-5B]
MHGGDEHEVDVVVVGAGPGGAVLSYLLARSGVETLLLERHRDLDREFRGFGFQPDALRLFDEMDLLDPILDLDHREVRVGEVSVYDRSYEVFDFDDIPGPYDFALLMEQPPLLETIIEAASAFECFTYRPHTPVRDLVNEAGRVVGVRALDHETGEEFVVRSRLVVGADGRFSTVRTAAGIDPGLLDSSIELLWFKLPDTVAQNAAQSRLNEHGLLLYFGVGGGEVQLGWFVEKGTYPELRAEGIEAFRRRLVAVDPSLDAVFPEALPSFEACSLLHIEPGLSETWVRDGLLLLGDAAHVASPIGAQGNVLAIQDAVVAHAVVAEALDRGDGPLSTGTLRRYEQRRRPAVERVLRGQRLAERGLSWIVRRSDGLPDAVTRSLLRTLFAVPARIPIARLPFGRRLLTRAMFGPEPVHVDRTRFRE